ncbi:MAG: DNA recombination protein RmuC [Mariprofundaceae bacterium]|nr:DNA recombination protein RmuC [Mariprofundaceae bacterium]
MIIEIVLVGVIVLILGLWFVYDRKQKKAMTDQMVANASLSAQVQSAEKQEAELKQALIAKDTGMDVLNRELSDYKSSMTELETRLSEERKAAVEKLALLEDAKDKLGNEFKVLANQIFEEKGRVFSEQNRNSLDEVLKPMREQLGDFRKRVDEVHLNDSRDRASLKEHLSHLEKLNRQMSEDALGLTQALKGESKAQGNWGEMILERILETSGLREGHEFLREDSTDIGGGKRHRPDVIVRMPGEKHIIIDSKVSLTDYERALSASDPAERKKAVKAHVNSLKNHIRGLSDKRYDQLPNIHSPDYVLMFVPIEGAYMMAIEADQSIFETAFEKRVAVVTPSTLYATLKIIEQLWRYERQSENVVKLIDRASLLHDKMVTFVESFEDVGKRLTQAKDSYDTALGRIKTGPGNVINQIATLGTLAGKTKKELPAHLTEPAAISGQQDEVLEQDRK